MLWNGKSPGLCWMALCILERAFNLPAFSSQFCQLHFLLVKSLVVSQWWEIRVITHLFWAHTHTHTVLCMPCRLLDSGEYVRTFQSLLWTSRFPWKCLDESLIRPTGIPASATWDVNQLPSIAYDRCPLDSDVCAKEALRSIKEKPWECSFSGKCQTGQIVAVLWVWGFWRPPNYFYPSS